MKRLILCLAALPVVMALAAPAHAQILSGPATVIDGDTLDLTGQRVRLLGIDAPEAAQTCTRGAGSGVAWPCGAEASALLRELLAGRTVSCTQQGTDVYGRALAHCSAGRIDLGASLVSAGLAVVLDNGKDIYGEREAVAQAQAAGLWSGPFQTPSDYRAANPAQFAARAAPKAAPRAAARPAAQAIQGAAYFPNCDAARAAGRAPLLRGQAGYRSALDRDNDGVACEPYRGRR
jgi:endonuclease YncB( thermonuclease family)